LSFLLNKSIEVHNHLAGALVTIEESIAKNSKGTFQIIFAAKSFDISNELGLVARGLPLETRLEYVHLLQLHGGSTHEDKSETNPRDRCQDAFFLDLAAAQKAVSCPVRASSPTELDKENAP